MSGLLPLLKLIVDSGAVSPKAPTKIKIIGRKRKPTGRIATGDTSEDFRKNSEVHQCWDCDSAGEFYEYEEPPVSIH